MNPFKKDSKQISIFTTSGFPRIDSLKHQLHTLENQGIDFIEVGIPFSDPLADGPTIQETSALAIRNGINIDLIFHQLEQTQSSLPIVLMGYMNPVLNYGIEKFLKNAAAVNVAGLILPDMSVEIYDRYYASLFSQNGIEPIFLITPSTETERIRRIAQLCKNSFVYLVSSNSTTGNGRKIELGDKVKAVKTICEDTPLMVGFGVKDRKTVEQLWKYADGVIIGSAYLNAVKGNTEIDFIDSITTSLQQ